MHREFPDCSSFADDHQVEAERINAPFIVFEGSFINALPMMPDAFHRKAR